MSERIDQADEWRRLATCRDLDPFIFESKTREGIEEAKSYCGGCAVRSECLTYALVTGQDSMTWGGLTFFERQQVLRGERDRDDLSIAEEQFKTMPPFETTVE